MDERTQRHQQRIRRTSRYFYDLQKLRIASGLRATDVADTAELEEGEKVFLGSMSQGLDDLEKQAYKELTKCLKGFPIYEHWIRNQKGVGPGMAGVLLSSYDIERSETVSQMWALAGLAVEIDPETGIGTAPRRRKGQKAKFDPWLRAKLVKVMADCMIKARSPWAEVYRAYKHRKESQIVPVCAGCDGKGKAKYESKWQPKTETGEEIAEQLPNGRCANCAGTGGPAPWGKSKGHRDAAARRYMVKMFLLELHKQWRTLEGLPVRPPYAVEKLGMAPHSGPVISAAEDPETAAEITRELEAAEAL